MHNVAQDIQHTANEHTFPLVLLSFTTDNVNMPYPQFTFAQRNQPALTPQSTHESFPPPRPHWLDPIDPAALNSAELEIQKSSNRGVAPTSSKFVCHKFPQASEIIPVSSSSRRSQPIDIPCAPHLNEASQPISRHPPTYTYKCTLCWKEKELPCYTIGPQARIVCLDCWRWIHSVSVCWKCNEVVYRKEDAISFGWC